MKLSVEILTGSLFYVQVGDDATLIDLKQAIADQENLSLKRLILYLFDVQSSLMIGDDVSLKEFGIRDYSHIYLFFSPVDNCKGKCDGYSAKLDGATFKENLALGEEEKTESESSREENPSKAKAEASPDEDDNID